MIDIVRNDGPPQQLQPRFYNPSSYSSTTSIYLEAVETNFD